MASYQSEEDILAQKIEAMGEDLGRLDFDLWKECVWLHTKWTEYERLFGKSEERVNVLNSAAPSFFFLIHKVLFEDIIIHITRLTDPPEQGGYVNLTVCALPELLEDDEQTALVEDHVEQVLQAAGFARQHRNQKLAHLDLETIRGESPRPLEPATRWNVQQVLEVLRATLNPGYSRRRPLGL